MPSVTEWGGASLVLMDSGCWGANKCPHCGDPPGRGGIADPGLTLHQPRRHGEGKRGWANRI